VAWAPHGTRIAVGDNRGTTSLIEVDTGDTVELFGVAGGSFAWHRASGRYRWDGDPGRNVWWVIGWRRVELVDVALGGRPPVGEGEPLVPPRG
ncbi:MAG: hypothetical protein ACK5PP_09460, partial [Acidimicrobiales bacterium]